MRKIKNCGVVTTMWAVVTRDSNSVAGTYARLEDACNLYAKMLEAGKSVRVEMVSSN